MAVTHRYFVDWFGAVLAGSTELMPALRRRLADRGVNARGWRLYLDYGDALLAPLAYRWFKEGYPHNNVMHAVDYLKVLQACEMDVPPPRVLAESLQDWDIPDQMLSSVPPLLFRAAWKAVAQAEYEGEDTEDFVEREVVPVVRWFFEAGAEAGVGDSQFKAGWNNLLRRHEAWLAERRRSGKAEWALPVRSVEWGAYRFVGLATEAELEAEGSIMKHCVGSYGERCRVESLRIYSVRYRRTGKHTATLSVQMRADGRWEVEQLKAYRNADPDPRVWQAVPALLDTLELTCRTTSSEWLTRFRALSRAHESFDEGCELLF